MLKARLEFRYGMITRERLVGPVKNTTDAINPKEEEGRSFCGAFELIASSVFLTGLSEGLSILIFGSSRARAVQP